MIFTIVTGLMFAFGTELLQKYLTSSRNGDILDFGADAAGILAASMIIAIIGQQMLKIINRIFK